MLILLWLISFSLTAQEDGVSLSGRAGAEMRAYRYGTFNTAQENFFVRIYGRPTVQINNWKLPFSFNLGDYQKRYKQAFNKYGVSPTNGRLTFHLGHRTVPFSSLTLGHHNFLGGGVEIEPEERNEAGIRAAAVYGKFLKAVEPDTANPLFTPLSYSRTGYAARLGYGSKQEFIDLIYFSGSDNPESVDFDPDAQSKTPAANTVLGLNGAIDIISDLRAGLEVAFSGYTRDTRLPESTAPGIFNATLLAPFIDQNLSTLYTSAIKSSLEYRFSNHQLNLHYQRINPRYRTMGAYFFRDDVERIRLGGRFKLAQNKLMLMPELGWEHNDLLQSKLIRNGRTIFGLRSYYRHDQLTITGNYRNYLVNLRQRAATPTDSLLLRQVNTNLGINATQRLGENNDRSISGGIRYMATGQHAMDTTLRQYRNFGINGQYRMKLAAPEMDLTAGARVSIIRMPFFNSTRYQPFIRAGTKLVNEQLQLDINLAAILATTAGSFANTGWRTIVNGSYRLFENHRLTARIAYLWNVPAGVSASFSEFQGNVGYRVRF